MVYEEIPEKFNIAEYLLNECNLQKGRANKAALYYNDKSYTYQEISDQTNQVANFMKGSGITLGQHVGIFMHDRPEFISVFLGAIKAGAVPVLLNPKLKMDDLGYMIEDAKIVQLYTSDKLCDDLKKDRFESLKAVYDIDSMMSEIKEQETTFATASTGKDDPAFILYTSGSSGKSKGVIHLQHDMVMCNETYGKNILKATSNDVFYSHSKLPFAFGLASSLIYPFAVGATVVLNPEDSLYSIFDIVAKYRPTVFFAVPSVYNSILKLSANMDISFDSCRVCASTGEALPKKVGEDWTNKFHIDILQGYGSSEVVNFAIANRPDHNKYGSLGMPVSGYSVKIIDEKGNEVPTGEVGEIVISGESIMQGYLNSPEKTKDTLFGNSMKTSDRGYIDNDGFVWYVGRNASAFKISGKWVSAASIEDVIMEHDDVKEVAVDSEVSDDKLAQIVAYVVIDGNSYEQTVKQVKKKICSKLERTLIPKKFFFVKHLPKGMTGKIQRRKLKDVAVLCEI